MCLGFCFLLSCLWFSCLKILFSRMFFIGISWTSNLFLLKHRHFRICGRVHTQGGSDTQLKMLMKLSSKFALVFAFFYTFKAVSWLFHRLYYIPWYGLKRWFWTPLQRVKYQFFYSVFCKPLNVADAMRFNIVFDLHGSDAE